MRRIDSLVEGDWLFIPGIYISRLCVKRSGVEGTRVFHLLRHFCRTELERTEIPTTFDRHLIGHDAGIDGVYVDRRPCS
jgi:hypothetical protein